MHIFLVGQLMIKVQELRPQSTLIDDLFDRTPASNVASAADASTYLASGPRDTEEELCASSDTRPLILETRGRSQAQSACLHNIYIEWLLWTRWHVNHM